MNWWYCVFDPRVPWTCDACLYSCTESCSSVICHGTTVAIFPICNWTASISSKRKKSMTTAWKLILSVENDACYSPTICIDSPPFTVTRNRMIICRLIASIDRAPIKGIVRGSPQTIGDLHNRDEWWTSHWHPTQSATVIATGPTWRSALMNAPRDPLGAER